jgi:hypothetical protein
MALDKNEKLLVESVREFLADQAKQYLPQSDDSATNDNNFKNRGFEYQHRQINEMFAMKTAGLTYHDSICALFTKVHDYKYLDDPSFLEALKKEFSSQAIPEDEQKQAMDAIPNIISEFKKEAKEWKEKDYGFNQDLNGILKAGSGLPE